MPFSIRRQTVPRVVKPAPWRPAADRRREGRHNTALDGAVSARLADGIDVKLRNLSTRGASFESPMGLRVGTRLTLRLRTATGSVSLPGEVVRCRVTAIRHGRLRYETALMLSSDYPLFGDVLPRLDAAPAGMFD